MLNVVLCMSRTEINQQSKWRPKISQVQMLAARVAEFNKPYEICDVPTPKALGPYDVLLKTAVA